MLRITLPGSGRWKTPCAVQGRATTTATGFGLLPLPAKGQRGDDGSGQLHEPDGRDCGMTDAPQILLQHHLKKLRLPTFQGEYAKQAQLCAASYQICPSMEVLIVTEN